MSLKNQKAIAMMFVLGIIMVVVILANIILSLILSQSRISSHQINRIRAYYAAMAGVHLAHENLRTGVWASDPNLVKFYCINGRVDSGVICESTVNDTDIPYNVQIEVRPTATDPGINNTAKLRIKTEYTTPQ